MDAIADTSLLIDLWRESRRTGAAAKFLNAHASWQIGLPWVTKAEFLAGAIWSGHDFSIFAPLLDRYQVIHSSNEIIDQYAQLHAILKRRNAFPGPNDIWVAAISLTIGCGVITRNVKHFKLIDGVTIWNYSE